MTSEANDAPKFAHAIWAFQHAQSAFEEALEEIGLVSGEHYQRIGWDEYDISIEFYGVSDDVRLSEQQQRIIYDAGFGKIYVNHMDGWETHYHWTLEEMREIESSGKFLSKRGWRRRWVSDPSARTTRSVGEKATPENAGYYEISEWPESWTHREWLTSGFIRVMGEK